MNSKFQVFVGQLTGSFSMARTVLEVIVMYDHIGLLCCDVAYCAITLRR